jgi:hypothetical protein
MLVVHWFRSHFNQPRLLGSGFSMKSFILSFIAAASAYGQADFSTLLLVQPKVSGAAPTYLLNQNFEGTGYDNSEAWLEAGTPNEDYTTSPAPLEGSQSLLCDLGGNNRAFSPDFAATADAWGYVLFRPLTIDLGDTPVVFRRLDGAAVMSVIINATGNIRIEDASVATSYTTDAMAVGTTYHIRVHYVKGTGANAVYSAEFSTDGTFAGSGNKFTGTSVGVSTDDATSIRLAADTGTCSFIFDKARVDNAVIGNNPP